MKLKRRKCPVHAEWEPLAKIPRKTLAERGSRCEMDRHNKRKPEDRNSNQMVIDYIETNNFPVKRKRQDYQILEIPASTLENNNLQTVSENSFLFWGSKETKSQDRNKMDVDSDNNIGAPEHPEFSCFTYWKPPFPEMPLTDIG